MPHGPLIHAQLVAVIFLALFKQITKVCVTKKFVLNWNIRVSGTVLALRRFQLGQNEFQGSVGLQMTKQIKIVFRANFGFMSYVRIYKPKTLLEM